jgi:hypothetical protein
MKMQQESLEAKKKTGLKEKQFFYPTTFEKLEIILRNNFNGVTNMDDNKAAQKRMCRAQEVKFYTNSTMANDAFQGEQDYFLWPLLLLLSAARRASDIGMTINPSHTALPTICNIN